MSFVKTKDGVEIFTKTGQGEIGEDCGSNFMPIASLCGRCVKIGSMDKKPNAALLK